MNKMPIPITVAAMACFALLATLAGPPVRAQLLPGGPLGGVGRIGEVVDRAASPVLAPVRGAARDLRDLARERVSRLADFVTHNPDRVAWDEQRQPAVKGEVLLIDPDPAALTAARDAGFTVIEEAALEGLDVRYARLATPGQMPLGQAVRQLRKVLPGREISADQLHFPAGSDVRGSSAKAAAPPAMPRGGTVGIVDGGIAAGEGTVRRAFAPGGMKVDDHAAAIASLLKGAGTARIYSADVYGGDPAGGNALAIAKALGWMQSQSVPVVSISLVGPSNPLLSRAIAAAQRKGMVIVAAVGNDGAAAPPAYPASYSGVVAVTGVDGAGRVLIEAGRASHLDYAAPGADMSALVPGRGRISLRGTSYAAPLAASRIAARRTGGETAAQALRAVDGEAIKGSRKLGRGVVCNICRSGL